MVTECNECYKGEMSIRHAQREAVIERLAGHMLEHGLAAISLRQLAAAAGVSDRMLLYYFADKAEVLSVTLTRIAKMMADALVEALLEGGDEYASRPKGHRSRKMGAGTGCGSRALLVNSARASQGAATQR